MSDHANNARELLRAAKQFDRVYPSTTDTLLHAIAEAILANAAATRDLVATTKEEARQARMRARRG